jgi:Tfp pilus assembly protein FimT
VEPIVVTATRTGAFGFSETELLIGSAVVIAVLAWMVVARMRRGHQPH